MMPEIAAGKTTRTAVVDRRAPMPNDASPELTRHGAQRVLGDRRDQGRREQADRQPGGEQRERMVGRREEPHDEIGVDEADREVAEHDARNAREQLEGGLQHSTHPRLRVLRQVHRGPQPDRRGDEHRDQRRRSGCRRRA